MTRPGTASELRFAFLHKFGFYGQSKSGRDRLPSPHSDGVRSNRGAFQGFTLLELMIVIAILSILAALGVSFLNQSKRAAYEISAKHDVNQFATAQEAYFDDHGFFNGSSGKAVRNDGAVSDFELPGLVLSPGVVITVKSGNPADPYNESSPFIVESSHTDSSKVYEYNFSTQAIIER